MHSEYIRKAEPLGFALRLTLGVDPGYRLTLVTLQVTRTEPEPPRPPPRGRSCRALTAWSKCRKERV